MELTKREQKFLKRVAKGVPRVQRLLGVLLIIVSMFCLYSIGNVLPGDTKVVLVLAIVLVLGVGFGFGSELILARQVILKLEKRIQELESKNG